MGKLIGILIAGIGYTLSAATTVCETDDGKLRAKIIPRSSGKTAVLVLSDPSVQVGRKTIAVFSNATIEDDTVLRVVAKVDFRNRTLKRGEYIGGTRLGELKQISLSVDDDDEKLNGVLALLKRNGDTTYLELACR